MAYITRTFEHDGRRFEVMYETSGRWKGFVHIFNKQRSRAGNRDVVVSGAKWNGSSIVAAEDDIFDEIGPRLIEPASVALREALSN